MDDNSTRLMVEPERTAFRGRPEVMGRSLTNGVTRPLGLDHSDETVAMQARKVTARSSSCRTGRALLLDNCLVEMWSLTAPGTLPTLGCENNGKIDREMSYIPSFSSTGQEHNTLSNFVTGFKKFRTTRSICNTYQDKAP